MADFSLNFADVDGISLNGQNVTKISDGTNTLWENKEYNLNYMWMQNTSDEVGTFTLTKTGTPNATELYYSLDKFHWTALDLTQATNTVSVPAGGRIWFRGDNTNGFNAGESNVLKFGFSVSHTVGGDIRSLLSSIDFESITTMPNGCYSSIFVGDTTLTSAKQLEIHYETISYYGFRNLFRDCTNLVEGCDFDEVVYVGERGLSATFRGCSSLSTPPLLTNITQLTGRDAMSYMFYNCTSLRTSPDLSSITLDAFEGSMFEMFYGCTSLNYVKCPNVSTWNTSRHNNWLSGVSATGTFVKPSDLTVPTSSTSGIPSGWTVENYHTWLSFHDVSGSANTLTLTKTGTPSAVELEYSTDKVNWSTWTESGGVRTYSIPANGTVWVRGDNSSFSQSTSNYYTFSCTGNHTIAGNCNTIMSKNGSDSSISSYCFSRLFNNNTKLTSAENMLLPSTSLVDNCYYRMFFGCVGLVTPMKFPSEGITSDTNSFSAMFYGCSSMTTVPPFTLSGFKDSSTGACNGMFRDCTHITDASVIHLNPTVLVGACYKVMFYHCTALTTAPYLPATDIAVGEGGNNGVYADMFNGCSSLSSVRVRFTDWYSGTYTQNWLNGVSSSGTFYKPSSLPTARGTSYIPTNWTVTNI